MTPDITSIPDSELRTRLRVALEEVREKNQRIIELELKAGRLEDTLDGIDASQGLSGSSALVALQAQSSELVPAAERPFVEPAPGLDVLAAFIGLDASCATSTTALMAGLRRLRDGGAVEEEGTPTDTIAEAIEHNRAERKQLGRDLATARQIVNQVAAALQVSTWDPVGTQIIERAQRLGVVAHTLRARLRAIENPKVVTPHDQGDAAERAARRQAASDELRGLLMQLLAPEALAKFLAAKPSFVATPAMFEIAAAPAAEIPESPFLTTFTIDQLEWLIAAAVAAMAHARLPYAWECCQMLRALDRSATAKSDVVALFRGAVLPILRAQVAQGVLPVGDLPAARPALPEDLEPIRSAVVPVLAPDMPPGNSSGSPNG